MAETRCNGIKFQYAMHHRRVEWSNHRLWLYLWVQCRDQRSTTPKSKWQQSLNYTIILFALRLLTLFASFRLISSFTASISFIWNVSGGIRIVSFNSASRNIVFSNEYYLFEWFWLMFMCRLSKAKIYDGSFTWDSCVCVCVFLLCPYW